MLPRRTGLLSEKSVADFWVPTGSQHFIRSDACFQQSDLMNGSDPPAIRVCSGWAELGQRALNGHAHCWAGRLGKSFELVFVSL